MPKVKITGLPKMQFAGQCPEGMTYVQGKGCIPTRFAGVGTPSTSTTNTTVTPIQQGQGVSDGCQAGFARNQRGECVPAYTLGIDPNLANTGSTMGPFPDDIGGSGVTANSTTTTTTASSDGTQWKKDLFAADLAARIGLNLGSGLARIKENRRVKKEFEKAFREASFSGPVQPGRDLGNVETNTGVQFPNLMTPPNEGMFITQFGGNLMGQYKDDKIKIRIEAGPEQMKFGGQSGYGLDMGWRKSYTEMSKTKADHYTNTMSEDKSADADPAVIEAEGGETFIRPEADGTASFFELRGKRHSEGGIPLSQEQVASQVPQVPSFMFSDTPKLKIKNAQILEMFGVPKSKWKKGMTPAEISKKFSLNEWNAIIKDINKDDLAKNTAQMMIDKNTAMLAKLAAVQESMKGEELPVFAKQQLMQGKAKYGGGLLPKYQKAGSMDWTKDFEQVKGLLTSPEFADLRKALYDRYKADRGKSDNVTEDEYIASLLEGQRQKYVINEKLATDPRLKSKNWDAGPKQGFGKNVFYNTIAKELGLSPQSGTDILRSQQAFQDMYDLLSSEPEFIKKYGNVFALERKGVADDPGYKGQKNITRADSWRGNTDIGQIIRLAKAPTAPKPPDIIPPPAGKKPVPPGQEMRYVCTPDPNNKGRFIAKGVMVTEGAGGFTSPQEAEAFCNRGSKDVPFGYTAPDAYNMVASSAVFPRLIMPFVPTPQLETAPLALEDWRARTANRFSTMYAAPAQTLASYTGPQGLAANLSKLSGEAAQAQAAQDMAPVISGNINRANQWFNQTAGVRNQQRALEAQAQEKRWTGRAVALQQYDNALRGYLKDFGKSFDRAWNNRQKLGDINDTNVHFFKDPWTGRQVFKGNTAGFAGLGAGYSTGSDMASLGSAFNSYYSAYLESLKNADLSDEKKKEKAADLAMLAIRGSKQTQRTDKYGNPVGGSSTMFDLDEED
jgi:hypothetical protein